MAGERPMTEAEWLACDSPRRMLAFPPAGWTDRGLRLFACGCARRTDWLMELAGAEAGVEAAESWADGGWAVNLWGLIGGAIAGAAGDHPHRQHFSNGSVLFGFASADARAAAGYTLAWFCGSGDLGQPSGAGAAAACDLLREVVGNPFRPVAFDPQWRTVTAVAIANLMYDTRDFSPMPILADALQDAGCDDSTVLDHCREPAGVHVRGCWVVDLVLGKA